MAYRRPVSVVMMASEYPQQVHGYNHGHQLLAGNLTLSSLDQDAVDRLSDISGPLSPSERFSPYLTMYPLPNRSHYVIARTWQDLEAPRAGCVLTRSLFVPMHEWEQVETIQDIVLGIAPVERKSPLLAIQTALSYPRKLPPVSDPRMPELVEALFLEARQPVLIFEVLEAELVAERLLTALWPAMRRNFSTCTMALAPRSLGGKSFDLLFAPKGARNRFSEWTGRRIELSSSVASTRHRWTQTTAEQIFVARQPNLSALDALGALRLDRRGDEAALRLSLLWNELNEKSLTSPTAVLGMLDILHSQSQSLEISPLPIVPIVNRAVDLSVNSQTADEAWTFLVSLLGKLEQHWVKLSVLRKVMAAAAKVASSDPDAALRLLRNQNAGGRLLPRVLCAGLASGLVTHANPARLLSSLGELPSEILLRLVSSSNSFAQFILTAVDTQGGEVVSDAIVRSIQSPDRFLCSRARLRLVPKLNSNRQAPILGALVEDSGLKTLLDTAAHIGRNNGFACEAFDAALQRPARTSEAMRALQNLILSFEETPQTDRFLTSTLQFSQSDIRWLVLDANLDSDRRVRILNDVLDRSEDRAIQNVLMDQDIAGRLLQLLSFKESAIARLLLLGDFAPQQTLEAAVSVLPKLSGQLQQELSKRMLHLVLTYSDIIDETISAAALGLSSNSMPPADIITAATFVSMTALSANLLLFARAANDVKKPVLQHIDLLADRLVQRRGTIPHVAALEALAGLVLESGNWDQLAQTQAAELLLPYALRHRQIEISPLIVAVFPIAYAELANNKSSPNLTPFYFFHDWDRAKVARKGLVDAFIGSVWRPANLLVAALGAGIVVEILTYLMRKHNGKEYLAAIKADMSSLPDKTQLALKQAIRSQKGFSKS